jgi:hypothetical protein
MEAVSTSKTSVNVYESSLCNIPENCHFHERSGFVATIPAISVLKWKPIEQSSLIRKASQELWLYILLYAWEARHDKLKLMSCQKSSRRHRLYVIQKVYYVRVITYCKFTWNIFLLPIMTCKYKAVFLSRGYKILDQHTSFKCNRMTRF